MNESWKELLKMVHYSIQYAVYCNDLTLDELADNIEFAINKFAKENGLPEHDFGQEYEEIKW